MRKLTHDEISQNRLKIDTLHKAKKIPVTVVLDNIRSSYNVGSIFRTSDGAMIEKLFLCGYTPYPPNKEVLKTALGATESVNWEHTDNIVELVKTLKNEGFLIGALEQTSQSIPHYDFEKLDLTKKVCLIIGNEIKGVNDKVIELCDFALEIPQYGIKQSLNVAVAYGITIFRIRETYAKCFPEYA